MLYTNNVVAGEVAGINIGLLMGNALRIALTVYGRQEEADTLIEQMTRDQDAILRYGDVSDDVRRTVVLAIGFVLYSEPEQSYNPHIRYGAAIAVKISYVNTVLSEVIPLLEPLTSDGVDFVHQGALIVMAKVMVKINGSSDSRVGTFKFIITHNGSGHNVASLRYKEYQLQDYSSEIGDRIFISIIKYHYQSINSRNLKQYKIAKLTPIEASCCRAPSKAGVAQYMKTEWTVVAIFNVVLLVVLSMVYLVGCYACQTATSSRSTT
ncbi:26S proteasome non-ATPase regulatory subunit 1-like B [Vitis vinifera]|uniref:26S proteasome non-ATPase regulatory subunit 1-like B n=1 Tax=Vitis vinifera TaxID=29760 RepID=A0A438HTX9_VITVI|nr:26S proteasome non-ATPase regulatory subunit 1-like B [Vitis vinifera]